MILARILPRNAGFAATRLRRTQSTKSSQPEEEPKRLPGKVARRFPAYVTLKPGTKYYWCACGLSQKQPFCDGSHKKMGEAARVEPVVFQVPTEKRYLLCCCKHTYNRPYCDLTHIRFFLPRGLRRSLGLDE